MNTMNISLPASMKAYVDEQVAGRGYGSCSAYIRELIRQDLDRQHLRSLLLEGGESEPSATSAAAYFDKLRASIRRRSGE